MALNPFSMLTSGLTNAMAGAAGQSPFLRVINAATGANPFAVDTGAKVGQAVQPALDMASLDPAQSASQPAATQQPPATPTVASSNGPRDYTPVIAQAAQRYGVDPQTALRVAKSEGGTKGWIRAQYKKGGKQEPSFGPFQLLVGGGDTGFPEGMGNQFMRETGLDPRDERNAEAVIDFAMKQASKLGWGQWYGAAKAGIGKFDGIGGKGNGQAYDYASAKGAKAGQFTNSTQAAPKAGGSQGGAIDRVIGALGGVGVPTVDSMPRTDTAPLTPVQRVAQTLQTIQPSARAKQAGTPQEGGAPETPAPVDLAADEIATLQEGLQQRKMTPSQRAAERKQKLTAATRFRSV